MKEINICCDVALYDEGNTQKKEQIHGKWHGGCSTGPKSEAGKEQAKINGRKGGRLKKAEIQETIGKMLNAVQAAEFLGISARSIYSMAAPDGPIPCYRFGKRLFFDERELQAYKESCRCVQFKMPTPTLSRTFPKLKVSTPC